MGNKTELTYKHYHSGGSNYWNNVLTNTTASWVETYRRLGSDSPKYMASIKAGSSAVNPMTVTAQNVLFRRPKASAIYVYKGHPKLYGQSISCNLFNINPMGSHTELPPAALLSSVKNNALIGIIKKIRAEQTSEFSGPQFLVELRETISMIKNPLAQIRKRMNVFTTLQQRVYADRVKRGRRAKDKISKDISDTWLEFALGITPLLGDIESALALSIEMIRGRSTKLKRLSYTFTDDYKIEQGTKNAAWTGTSLYISYKRYSLCRSSCNYTVWLKESIRHPGASVEAVLDASKFRLDEIVPTVWEAIPFSWLIDYFTNIGDILGCTFDYNGQIAFGQVVTRDSVTIFDDSMKPISGSPGYEEFSAFEPWQYESTYKRIVRSKQDSLGFPQLSISLPSIMQTINIAALFSSLRSDNPQTRRLIK